MNQKWDSHEKNLQRLKGIINFNSLRKKLILLNQLNKKGHYWRIVGNETFIKVGKSKKTLDILNKNWSSPINNGLNLARIHGNAIFRYDATQDKLMKFTFFQFGVKFNLPKLLQNQTYKAWRTPKLLNGLKCESKLKITEEQGVRACSLARNILKGGGVKGRTGIPGWD
jgi:hypothetical protein